MYSYFLIVPKFSNKKDINKGFLNFISSKLLQYSQVKTINGMHLLIKKPMSDNTLSYYEMSGSVGGVIGILFNKKNEISPETVGATFREDDVSRIISSKGGHLMQYYWGRYVAFFYDNSSNSYTIVRDPSGSLPAYYAELPDHYVVFSEMEDFIKLKLMSLSFNFDHLVTHAIMVMYDQIDTGFSEINKINKGCAIQFCGEQKSIVRHWSPRNFCNVNSNLTYDVAANSIRNVIIDCINKWSSRYNRIAHGLSGGLDSSIVLSCLSKIRDPKEISCLTYYSKGIDSDERELALTAARYSGSEIFFKEEIYSETDLKIINDFKFSAEPAPCRYTMTRGAFEKQFMKINNADAFFNGDGGDGVFYQGGDYCASDFLYHKGFNIEFIRKCLDSAQLRKLSFIYILKESISHRLTRPKWDVKKFLNVVPSPLVSPEIINELDLEKRYENWISNLFDLPIAKQFHVALTQFQDYHYWPNRPDDEIVRIQPLLSQPILEVVYSIPCHFFDYAGADRGLARMAFLGMVHPTNLKRQSKGGIGGYLRGVYLQNIKFLKEYILDGMAVQYGIFDRSMAERALNADVSANNHGQTAILTTLGLEAWMRKWNSNI